MAEEEGFEPPRGVTRLSVFKTDPFSRTWVFLRMMKNIFLTKNNIACSWGEVNHIPKSPFKKLGEAWASSTRYTFSKLEFTSVSSSRLFSRTMGSRYPWWIDGNYIPSIYRGVNGDVRLQLGKWWRNDRPLLKKETAIFYKNPTGGSSIYIGGHYHGAFWKIRSYHWWKAIPQSLLFLGR